MTKKGIGLLRHQFDMQAIFGSKEKFDEIIHELYFKEHDVFEETYDNNLKEIRVGDKIIYAISRKNLILMFIVDSKNDVLGINLAQEMLEKTLELMKNMKLSVEDLERNHASLEKIKRLLVKLFKGQQSLAQLDMTADEMREILTRILEKIQELPEEKEIQLEIEALNPAKIKKVDILRKILAPVLKEINVIDSLRKWDWETIVKIPLDEAEKLDDIERAALVFGYLYLKSTHPLIPAPTTEEIEKLIRTLKNDFFKKLLELRLERFKKVGTHEKLKVHVMQNYNKIFKLLKNPPEERFKWTLAFMIHDVEHESLLKYLNNFFYSHGANEWGLICNELLTLKKVFNAPVKLTLDKLNELYQDLIKKLESFETDDKNINKIRYLNDLFVTFQAILNHPDLSREQGFETLESIKKVWVKNADLSTKDLQPLPNKFLALFTVFSRTLFLPVVLNTLTENDAKTELLENNKKHMIEVIKMNLGLIKNQLFEQDIFVVTMLAHLSNLTWTLKKLGLHSKSVPKLLNDLVLDEYFKENEGLTWFHQALYLTELMFPILEVTNMINDNEDLKIEIIKNILNKIKNLYLKRAHVDVKILHWTNMYRLIETLMDSGIKEIQDEAANLTRQVFSSASGFWQEMFTRLMVNHGYKTDGLKKTS